MSMIERHSEITALPIELKDIQNQFTSNQKINSIFENLLETIFCNPEESHEIVGARWLIFSREMPTILQLMAANLPDTSKSKKNIDRIHFEEIGEGDNEQVHSALYRNSLLRTGMQERRLVQLCEKYPVTELDELKLKVMHACPSVTMGIALGLELVAVENIYFLAVSFMNRGKNGEQLQSDPFFQLHFKNEVSHIQSNFENYLHLKSKIEQYKYTEGVRYALEFWLKFWQQTIIYIRKEKNGELIENK